MAEGQINLQGVGEVISVKFNLKWSKHTDCTST